MDISLLVNLLGIRDPQAPILLTAKKPAATKKGRPKPAPPILKPSLYVAAISGDAASVPAILITASDEYRSATSVGRTSDVA